jgi:magnesium-transporting ATPase (P-type)
MFLVTVVAFFCNIFVSYYKLKAVESILKLKIQKYNFYLVSRTESHPDLSKKPPPSKLMSWRPIGSLLGHMLLVLAFQLFVFFYVQWQPWFVAYEDSESYASYQNSAIFIISMFQYLYLPVVFSKSTPFRKTIFTNCKNLVV